MAPSRFATHTADGEAIAREITEYLNLGNIKHNYFHRGAPGVKVVPLGELFKSRSKTPSASRIDFVQPGRQTQELRIRRLPTCLVGAADDEHNSLAYLQYGVGHRWFALQRWVDRRYRRCSMPLANAADVGLLGVFEAYITEQRMKNMEFWARTNDLQTALRIPEGCTHWEVYFQHKSGPFPGINIRGAPSKVHDSPSLDARLLQVDLLGIWVPFLLWIKLLLKDLPIGAGTQQEWWDFNGKFFPFMKLPAELRLCVYEKVYGQYLWPHGVGQVVVAVDGKRTAPSLRGTAPTYVAQEASWNFNERLQMAFKDPHGQRPPGASNLMAASRTILQELGPHIRNHTFKHTARISVMFRSLHSCPKGTLSRVSFGMTKADYFKLLGYKCDRFTGFATAYAKLETPIVTLKKFSALKHVQFDFKVVQPRMVNGRWQSADPWSTISGRTSQRVSCQKIFVDWFFTMALAHVRHIPKITILGHVKDTTRITWDEIFEQERKGVQHDLSHKIQAIQSLPWQHLPPWCTCEHPCDSWGLNGPYLEGEMDPNFDTTRSLRDHNHVRFICED